MTDYVVVLTEKYDLLHLQLLDARQLIDKNHIVIERDKVDKVTINQSINIYFGMFTSIGQYIFIQ